MGRWRPSRPQRHPAGGIVREGGVERLDVLCRDTGFAAAVRRGTDLSGNRLDQRTKRLIIRRSGRNDAVAVELRLLENGDAVGSLFHTDFVLFQTEIGENLFRGSKELLPGLAVRVDAVEPQHAFSFEDGVPVLEHGGQPLRRGNDLRHADATVAVGVDQLQGTAVEREIPGRAAQDRP